jgi:RNA polymerase sigma-70 factor (ECF subfamily)
MSGVLTIATNHDTSPASSRLEERIQAAVEGDRGALEEVLMAVERRVFTFAWRLSGDREAAEDITQEVLLKIASHLDRYRPGSNLWAWIHRIVVNQVHDHRRGLRRELPLEEANAPGYQPELEQQLARLQQALGVLTPKEREALILLDVEGYTSREAAAIVGSLSITVRTRAAHARRKVRRYLSQYYAELGEQS